MAGIAASPIVLALILRLRWSQSRWWLWIVLTLLAAFHVGYVIYLRNAKRCVGPGLWAGAFHSEAPVIGTGEAPEHAPGALHRRVPAAGGAIGGLAVQPDRLVFATSAGTRDVRAVDVAAIVETANWLTRTIAVDLRDGSRIEVTVFKSGVARAIELARQRST
jgi:hypothetical protein